MRITATGCHEAGSRKPEVYILCALCSEPRALCPELRALSPVLYFFLLIVKSVTNILSVTMTALTIFSATSAGSMKVLISLF